MVLRMRADSSLAVGKDDSRASSTDIWKSGGGGAVLRSAVEGWWVVYVILN